MKKKLLCLFDSYPSEDKQLGTFYQSQISILKDYFDIQLIIINGEVTSLSKWRKEKMIINEPYVDHMNNINVHKITVNSPFNDKWLRNVPKLNRKILSKHVEVISNQLLDYQNKIFEKPDLIYIQTAQYLLPFGAMLKSKLNIPLVCNEHYPVDVQMTPLWDVHNLDYKILVKKAAKNADNFIAVSQYLATVLYSVGFQNKFNVIGNYIRIYNDKPTPIKKKEFKILYIGYNNYLKGSHTFFKAIQILKEKDKSIKFLILTTFDDFSEKIRMYDVEDVIEVRRGVPHKEVIKIMKEEASVFVSTSLAENWPVSIAEAIACELPVITTNNGGNMDYITKENAILIERKNPEQLSENILRIKNGLYKYDGKMNSKNILKKFGKEAFTKKLIDNLNSVLDS